jgi:hypothetical protein
MGINIFFRNTYIAQVEKCIPMGISEHNCQSSDHPPKEHYSKTVYIKPNHFHLKHWNAKFVLS